MSTLKNVQGATWHTEKRIFNVVLLGKTGSGKSATGNTLLRRVAFKASNKAASETNMAKVESSEFRDFILNVVDTPGFNDTKISLKKTLARIYDAMSLCPEGFNALVYVLSFPLRFTEEEAKILLTLKRIFGESFTKEFCVVIMTKGDSFAVDNEEKGKDFTFDDWLKEQKEPKQFRILIEECHDKVVLFFNKGIQFQKDRENSVDKFLGILKSKPNRYKNTDFEKFAKERNRILTQFRLSAQKEYVQKLLSLTSQDIHKLISLLNEGCKDCTEIENLTLNVEQRLKQLKEQLQNDDQGTNVNVDLIKEVDLFLDLVNNIKMQPMGKKSEHLKKVAITVEELKNQTVPQKWKEVLKSAAAFTAATFVSLLALPLCVVQGTFSSVFNLGETVYSNLKDN